jgi:predicted secreted hydrolase
MLTAAGGSADEEGPSQLAVLLGSDADPGFMRALEPRRFSFPADHGAHPAFRNEWWYVTGNLDSDDDRRFGFELTFFRFALTPESGPDDSSWRSSQVYIAHLALTDVSSGRFHVAERFSRGAAGLAGAEAEPFRVWIDDWHITALADGRWRLQAGDDLVTLDLELTAQKAPVLNGIDGLSQKSGEPGNASYYYSITRLAATGDIRVVADDFTVRGLAWLDREWSSSALADNQQGWDWFALQLSDGSDLMFYQLRGKDGSKDIHSAGTWTGADGAAEHLRRDDVRIEVLDTWTSPQGGDYPARWRVTLPARDIDLHVTPVMADQELFTTVRYWEGAVDVKGTRKGEPLGGRGYVELTGYAQ